MRFERRVGVPRGQLLCLAGSWWRTQYLVVKSLFRLNRSSLVWSRNTCPEPTDANSLNSIVSYSILRIVFDEGFNQAIAQLGCVLWIFLLQLLLEDFDRNGDLRVQENRLQHD
jgi:hypothetical protein